MAGPTRKKPARKRADPWPRGAGGRPLHTGVGPPDDPGPDMTDEDSTVSIHLVDGRAAMWPDSVARLDPHLRSLLGQLSSLVASRRQLEREIDALVMDCRAHGISWNHIGWGVLTSAEAARQRWGPMERDELAGD